MRNLWSILRRAMRCEAGTASLEAVIMLPVLISLMVGGIEFGRILSADATVNKTMRNATRYLASVPLEAVCGWGFTNAQNLAVYGQISGGSTPVLPDFTPAMVTRFAPSSCVGLTEPVVIELRASVPYTVFMLSALGFSNTRTITAAHQERHIGP